MGWLFLSYELSNEISGYGGSEGIKVHQVRSMCCGDTSNNTEFSMPTHFGTHMDFPYHFSSSGKKSSEYIPENFIFEKVFSQHLDLRKRDERLISSQDLNEEYPSDTELLIIKTCFSHIRSEEEYWKNGPGFKPEVAATLKEKMPSLRAIAFDAISLTNFQNRELGRTAHKSFLLEKDLLIIEDVDLSKVGDKTHIKKVIISPLRLKNSDGAPVTIFAEIKDD